MNQTPGLHKFSYFVNLSFSRTTHAHPYMWKHVSDCVYVNVGEFECEVVVRGRLYECLQAGASHVSLSEPHHPPPLLPPTGSKECFLLIPLSPHPAEWRTCLSFPFMEVAVMTMITEGHLGIPLIQEPYWRVVSSLITIHSPYLKLLLSSLSLFFYSPDSSCLFSYISDFLVPKFLSLLSMQIWISLPTLSFHPFCFIQFRLYIYLSLSFFFPPSCNLPLPFTLPSIHFLPISATYYLLLSF